jgi:indole-3-glycerol phosphate synthase
MSILDDIVRRKRDEIRCSDKSSNIRVLRDTIKALPQPRDFAAALSMEYGARNRIIAEIKKASPSKGVIRRDFDPSEIALSYEKNGAVAISVLTDETFFQGSLDHLDAVKRSVTIPVLRKDFILEPFQIYEAFACGADAVLLIVAILDDHQLGMLLQLCAELGLAALVEVHNREELSRALDAGSHIIGINNRDLNTFITDIKTTLTLLPAIPENVVTVSESGIQSAGEIQRLRTAGVDAFLIGEALMQSPSPGEALRSLVS